MDCFLLDQYIGKSNFIEFWNFPDVCREFPLVSSFSFEAIHNSATFLFGNAIGEVGIAFETSTQISDIIQVAYFVLLFSKSNVKPSNVLLLVEC